MFVGMWDSLMSDQAVIEPLALTVDQAVKASALSRWAIYGGIKRGELCARKAGQRTIILTSDLKAWLERFPPAPRAGSSDERVT